MPTIEVNGAELYYEDQGGGDETIVFAHGLVFDHRMYAAQVAHFRDRYRCVTFDFRGQGKSQVTASGYDMDSLSRDAAALMDALALAPGHFVGTSMGGFVGLRLALRRPDLLRSLVLLDSSAEAEPRENVPRYRSMQFVARWLGLRLVLSRLMPVMFGRDTLADPARAADRRYWRELMLDNDRAGIGRAAGGVISRQGVIDEIGAIRVPTLVAVGEQDAATVPEHSRRMHERIPGSKFCMIPGAGHMAALEQPARVNAIIDDFLASLPAPRTTEQQ